LFMVPMRRVFIEESPELPYPEGVACAAVLEAGEASADAQAGRAVLRGGWLGAAVKLLTGLLGVLRSGLEGAVLLGPARPLYVGADLSPALLAVGLIVRLEVASQIFLGGALGWLILLPFAPEGVAWLAPGSPALTAAVAAEADLDPVARSWELWSAGIRYVGVGAMAVGGLSALVRVRRGLARAVVELRRGWSAGRAGEAARVDLPSGWIAALIAVAVVVVAALYLRFTGDPGVAALATGMMVVASFFFVGVASYIVGLVGNSNSPVSGMTITAVLMTGGLLWLLGYTGVQGMVATLGVAAIVCCAACTAGDVCNDLKTGALVGASPARQQTMQLLGIVLAAFVMAPVLQLLHDAYGIGSRELAAPQASLFASLARGFFGGESLPWGLVGAGGVLGVGVLAVDAVLARRGVGFRLHLMPIAVGLYLPFGIAVPILVGGLVEWLGRRAAPAGDEASARRGVLFASGVVAGEALVGVAIAALVAFGLAPELGGWSGEGPATFVAAVLIVTAFVRAVRAPSAPD
ncbi:MAG: oligopeptide transporter, OPT family, partial [Myxococcota bacterium]